MSAEFTRAKPVFPKKLENEMNVSVFFVCDAVCTREGRMKISANSLYRIFDSGKLIGYGPARAAHGYYRVDEYALHPGGHHLVVEVVSYRCNSYYTLNTPPFFLCEIDTGSGILTSDRDFICMRNLTRIQKVCRFSLQRAFVEVYRLDQELTDFYRGIADPFPRMELSLLPEVNLLKRNVLPFVYHEESFHPVESGCVRLEKSRPPHEDRYMKMTELGIFPEEDWQENSNAVVSQMEFSLSAKGPSLQAKQFWTYALDRCRTGFVKFRIRVLKRAQIYMIFDEIDTGDKSGAIGILCFRNTTQNILSYSLCEGVHEHISFEPYTMRYLRIIVMSGEIQAEEVSLVRYEHPLKRCIEASFSDPKVRRIVDAGIATFAQNAVDILTDCPSRERAGWLCDSYFSGQSEQVITGTNAVERNFLENYALFETYPTLPPGMVPMCYPGECVDGVYIPNWALFYILELREYLHRTGDEQLLQASKAHVERLLDFFRELENEEMLLEDLPSWVFVEWSRANDADFVSGVNIPSNMLYAAALESAGEILEDPRLVHKSRCIRERIRALSYNGEFFVDNLIRDEEGKLRRTDHISETCQYYAFYFHAADQKSHPLLLKKLLKEFGPSRDSSCTYPSVAPSNVFIGDYLRLCILLESGYPEQTVHECVAYFDAMAVRTGTLWEHDSPLASLNHCFASYIVNILLESFFGLVRIDRLTRTVCFRKRVLAQTARVVIPLEDGDLILESSGGAIRFVLPSHYEAVYVDERAV